MAGMKGQSTEVRVLKDGNRETSLADVVSFETEDKLEIKAQGYLGETTDRHDEVYSGTNVTLTMHMQRASAFRFKQDLIDRARRRIPAFKVLIQSSFEFDNGERHRIQFPDVKFGTPRISSGARADYVTLTLNGSCDAPRNLD